MEGSTRSLAVAEHTLGPNDPVVADTLYNLGDCYLKQGKVLWLLTPI